MRLLIIAGVLNFVAAGADLRADEPPKAAPTVWLIGDSTVRNGTRGQQGWGDPFADLVDPVRGRVVNRALGGRSSRTFLTEGLWDKVAEQIRPGDYVLMQFGHNDGGGLGGNKSRASLKGTGEETAEITDEKTGAKVTVHTYGWYLRKYAADAKARGATPLILSPIPRNIWKDGKVGRASNDYGKWAKEAAEAAGAAFIDLNEWVAARYEREGQERVAREYFGATDHTHTTPAGAAVNAACVAEGIRAAKKLELSGLLKEKN